MDIRVEGLGKKYFREWIFRRMDFHFQSGKSYAITGPNGSGKSSFLKTISGAIPATEGNITYTAAGGNTVHSDLWPRHITFAAPYLEVVEEFSLKELLEFHFSFKEPAEKGDTVSLLAEKMYLQDSLHKQVRHFSSGMKQRLKLGLSFFTKAPILFLDEPTSNLDFRGIDWYLTAIDLVKQERLVIICSNQPNEYSFCNHILDISSFKGRNNLK